MNARPTPCHLAALLLLLWTGACGEKAPLKPALRPSGATLAYVAPETCKSCHHEAWKKWTGSDHHLAMQPATPDTVLADFDDATFEKDGVTTRFFRKDGAFFVETDGKDGRMTTYAVPYTFGVYPLQQYLLDVGEGRLQALSICWDVENKVWFHLYDESIPHDDPLHWTDRFQNWNYMCGECHVTEYDKGYDVASNAFETTWLALGVGCQECHGPGSAHVAWAKRAGDTVADIAPDDPKGLAVDLGAAEASVQIDACARCHARRDIVHAPFEHGTPFLDHYEPELLVHPLYFPDGQILDEVYVYGSFLQSKKRARGVRCSDCHDPHRAKLRFPGNATCTQCHQPESPERFPTLVERRKVYDAPAHTHHDAGTPGAACVDCHMTATTYMQVDPRRDHSFRIPRPDLTEKIGAPNACTGCHEKEGAAWAADRIASWFPESTKARLASTTFGEVFHQARQGDPKSIPALAGLAQDDDLPAIVRATALREMRRFGTPASLAAALKGARDAEPLVRLAALDLLQALIPRHSPPAYQQQKLDAVRPSLTDPLRAVRVEAARVLADVTPTLLTTADRQALAAALDEFRRRQEVLADRPEAWLNLGSLEEALGREKEAEQAYRKAIRIAPGFIPVRFNLANLLNRRGANAEAEALLRQIIALMPDHGEGHYSLGLLLAEEQKYGAAAAALSNAADLMPGRPRIQYNRALVLQRLGRLPEAAEGLERAHALAPQDAEIVHALALLYIQKHDTSKARIWAKKLQKLRPNDPAVMQILEATK